MKYKFNDITKFYKGLGPTDEVKEGESLVEALHWALTQDDIFNIALTGNYGSGKSSIIQTLLKKNEDIKEHTITISLADFNRSSKKQEDDEEHSNLELENLEKGILKQIFYKVRSCSIPNSRFKKIKRSAFWKDYGLTFSCISSCLLFLSFIFPNLKDSIIINIENGFLMQSGPYHLGYTVFFLSYLLFLTSIVYVYEFHFKKFSLKSLHIGSNQFQVDTNLHETVFDKYLNEIVYFFEENKTYNTIIFEDLDRFENLEIFIKLRELNRILNSDDDIQNRKITFVYAIRDDLFKGTERTKFFDFLIPVIPIINKNNAFEELFRVMHKATDYVVSDACLKTVGLYITEMRTLNNIFNEYYMYISNKNKFTDLSLNYDKLFSLIVFKNLEPEEFSSVQNGEGVLKKVFRKKNEFINNQINSIEKKKDEADRELKKYNNDVLNNISEIKTVMLDALAEHNYFWRLRSKSLDTISRETLMQDDFDLEQLKNLGSITVDFYDKNCVHKGKYRPEGIDLIIQPYLERIKYLTQKEKEDQERICAEYEKKYDDIRFLQQKSLKSLIEKYSFDEIFEDMDKCSELVRALLIRGYIDEQYETYINYFKEVSRTANDTKFALSVVQGRNNKWDYHLDNPKSIIDILQKTDFSRESIFNFNLLDYLVGNDELENYLDNVINTICENINNTISFLNEYLQSSTKLDKFLPKLFEKWCDAVDYIYYSDMSNFEKSQYFAYIIDYCDIAQIIDFDCNKCISNFINNNPDFLRMVFTESLKSKSDVSKWKDVIQNLDIKFESLNTQDVNTNLLDFIFENNCYDLNVRMLSTLIEYEDSQLKDAFPNKVYTTIRQLNYEPLLDYIDKNIKTLIENVFLIESNINENIESIICLIEKSVALDDSTYRMIFENKEFNLDSVEYLNINYDSLTNINKADIWDCALENNRLKQCWSTIIDYWNQYKYTDVLSEYIKNNIQKIVQSRDSIITNEFLYDFYNAYDVDFYKSHTKNYAFSKDVEFNKLNFDILDYIIENRLICFTPHNFNELSKVKVDCTQLFISNNEKSFRDSIEDLSIEDELYRTLISNNKFSLETRFTLLESKDGLYMDENLAKSFMNSLNPFKPKIYKYIIEALKDDENLQIQVMMKYLISLDKELLLYSFKWIKRYQKIYSSNGEIVRINNSKRNKQLVEYMKSKRFINNIKFTSNNIEFSI